MRDVEGSPQTLYLKRTLRIHHGMALENTLKKRKKENMHEQSICS